MSRLVIGFRTEPGFPPYLRLVHPGAGGTRSPGPARAPEPRPSPHWYTTTLSPFRTCAYRSAIAPSSRTLTQPWEAPA